MINNPHLPAEKLAFLRHVDVIAIGYHGVRLAQKAMDGTISADELATLEEMVKTTAPGKSSA